MSKKGFIIDSLLNITATTIPILILQLISLPIVGSKLGGEEYGLVVTLISLFTLLSTPFGNVLNNIRLLQNEEYEKESIVGDFNYLLIRSIILSSSLVILGTIYFEGTFSIYSIIMMIVISSINLSREYLIVSFRITLNYKGILLNNIILSVGYLVGTVAFYFIGDWQLIFLIGYGFSLFYILKNSNLLNEPTIKTKLFKKTTYSSCILLLSSILKNLMVYADKLMLFPLLGTKAVSIYYSATIMGKIISMAINPINSVILSYIRKTKRFGTKKITFLLFGMSIIGIFGYFISIIIGPYLLRILYREWAEDSIKILYITSATAIITVISSMINPFILRFTNINFQLIINGVYFILYIIFAFVFYNLYGLEGFCIGILLSSVINLVLMVSIFVWSNVKKGSVDKEMDDCFINDKSI
ncbi:lipopolysaccharide biosynthesis protein [Ureibacillus thermosphaericus]|uniref:lipopolysaccharide biosynthesis protein n=1 Tax=Ureibacillus thermosphaericus TaxID=51173 RepID=UPI0002D2738B|nr:hypothetical protein [Ureibacillus thermosphaericus]